MPGGPGRARQHPDRQEVGEGAGRPRRLAGAQRAGGAAGVEKAQDLVLEGGQPWGCRPSAPGLVEPGTAAAGQRVPAPGGGEFRPALGGVQRGGPHRGQERELRAGRSTRAGRILQPSAFWATTIWWLLYGPPWSVVTVSGAKNGSPATG